MKKIAQAAVISLIIFITLSTTRKMTGISEAMAAIGSIAGGALMYFEVLEKANAAKDKYVNEQVDQKIKITDLKVIQQDLTTVSKVVEQIPIISYDLNSLQERVLKLENAVTTANLLSSTYSVDTDKRFDAIEQRLVLLASEDKRTLHIIEAASMDNHSKIAINLQSLYEAIINNKQVILLPESVYNNLLSHPDSWEKVSDLIIRYFEQPP